MRRIAEVVLVVALLLAIGQAKCAGNRNGILTEQIRTEKAQTAAHLKSIKLTKDSLLVRDRELSLLKKVSARTVTKYRTLRDTLTLTDTIEVTEILEVADSAIVALEEVVAAHERKDVLQEALISKQDEQIKSLNNQIRLVVRQQRPPFLSRVASTTTKLAIGAAIGVVAWEFARD
jgi:succinate dehydrogenase/fumarate reductase flavoprotein subunit